MSGYLSDLIARTGEGLAEKLPSPWRVLKYLDALAGSKYVCVWDQGGSYGGEQTEEWNVKRQRIGILVVAGVAGSGFDGDLDTVLTDITPTVENAILWLIYHQFVTATAGHTTPPTYLETLPILTPDSGRQGLEHSNMGGRVIAKQFVLEVPIRIPTEIS